MSTLAAPMSLNGTVATYCWHWQGQPITCIYETLGSGQPVLLLPAFSTVSTRAEMAALATRLASTHQVTALDWPGFGESDRPRVDYRPEFYRQFLQDFVSARFDQPVAVVAAGHAAGYALALPDAWSKLVLVAPTWRGPLTVMGAPEAVRGGVRELVRSPLIGQALYGLNTQPAFLKWMYSRHVFVDESKLTPDYIARRHQSTQQPGARYAPAAFVTGGLDPVQSRANMLAYFEKLAVPVMVIVAEQAPSASRAEMEAMADQPQVQSARLPGSLGLAEEYGNEVAAAILPFLSAVSE
ncbi:alpha/beta hydrolase [Romeria aff. gracilis LEGE 07310]|uniref:Alpha/beta hydrolase n=1 Tax=Vasconcelosia minhoensis LEGE 07310 TaxID=915328 RepID=A0A8J7A4D8_9CYAN|nr:alpha/beta hydrolase [Romeria gracilis]MBE9076007.1 alpha/beta hydrolase [Romeria aff. gracilis LEGE 07310]